MFFVSFMFSIIYSIYKILLFIKQKFFFSTVSNYSSLSKRLEKILEHLFANVPKIQLDCPSLIKDG